MVDPQAALVELGGGDPFDDVYRQSRAHQLVHGCGLFPAGPAVMQLASMFVRAANAGTILDLGCGIGYSTFWLAESAPSRATVTGIDSDRGHIEMARAACSRLGLDNRVNFIVGEVAELLRAIHGPVDAEWERFAGPTWAADAVEYAEELAVRPDLAVSWIIRPPLGVAVKLH